MKHHQRKTAVTVAVTLLTVGCLGDGASTTNPLAPSSSASASQSVTNAAGAPASGNLVGSLLGTSSPYTGPYYKCAADSVRATGSATIGFFGGTIRFGHNTLVVPPAALLTPTTITATDPGQGYVAAQFQPQGLHFVAPAILTMGYGQCSPPPTGNLSIVFTNGLLGAILQLLPSVDDLLGKQVIAPITHFSVYMLADRKAAGGH